MVRPGQLSRPIVLPALVTVLLLAVLPPTAFGGRLEVRPEVLRRCEQDPTRLRDGQFWRNFRGKDQDSYAPLMQRIALDESQAWDVRARALTLLDASDHGMVFARFARSFDPLEVARGYMGAEAFNVLAVWQRLRGDEHGPVATLLLPGGGADGVGPLLQALAGKAIHDYLYLLYSRGYRWRPATIEALAETDDQLTRQLLSWYVGHARLAGMEGFLVAQIASSRPSTYASQAGNIVAAVLTAGMTEVIRTSVPTPGWLGDEASPKGLALQSLGQLMPAGQRIRQSGVADQLLAAARANATGKDRAQWQLSCDILEFLRVRQEPLAGRADGVLDGLTRQVLRRRGPLQPFVHAEEMHRHAGVPFPELSADERAAVWDVTLKTLNAEFLAAVIRALPDEARHAELKRHLLDQQEKAARGTLHVVRCWGAPIEGPGEWALAVAELGLTEAVNSVAKVLDTSYPDDAAQALIRMGEVGAPALAVSLRTDQAHRLSKDVRLGAIRACAEHLPAEQWQALMDELLEDRYLAEDVRQVERERISRDGGSSHSAVRQR